MIPEHVAGSPVVVAESALFVAEFKVWEQPPSKDRWQRGAFRNFFEGAMQRGGAFRMVDRASGKTIGSSRFYDCNPVDDSILIGYAFYAAACWRTGINRAVKKLSRTTYSGLYRRSISTWGRKTGDPSS